MVAVAVAKGTRVYTWAWVRGRCETTIREELGEAKAASKLGILIRAIWWDADETGKDMHGTRMATGEF